MRESDIIYEDGNFWVGKTQAGYAVFKNGITHSTSDSSYELTEDGKACAIARCKYLARMARLRAI